MDVAVIGNVIGNVIANLIVAALVNGNDIVEVIDLTWTLTQPADGICRDPSALHFHQLELMKLINP